MLVHLLDPLHFPRVGRGHDVQEAGRGARGRQGRRWQLGGRVQRVPQGDPVGNLVLVPRLGRRRKGERRRPGELLPREGAPVRRQRDELVVGRGNTLPGLNVRGEIVARSGRHEVTRLRMKSFCFSVRDELNFRLEMVGRMKGLKRKE